MTALPTAATAPPPSTVTAPAPSVATRSWAPMAAGLAICALCLLLTSTALQWSHDTSQQAAHDRFEHRVALLNDDVHARIGGVLSGLAATRALFAANGDRVTRAQFRAFVLSRDLPNEFPGVRGFGFIEHVPRAKLPQFLARERADGAPAFEVRTEGDAQDLYVIKFIEPLINNGPAWGYDIGSERARRAAAQRAVLSGEATLTARITLVQDGRRGPGWLYLMPVYRTLWPTETPEQRKAALLGLVYSPIVVAEVLKDAVAQQNSDIDFELFDGPVLSSEHLLFDADQHLGEVQRTYGPEDYHSRLFTSSRTLSIGGRIYTARYSSLPAFEATVDRHAVWIIGVCGTLLSLLAGFATCLVLGARSRALAAAHRMTADLERLAMVARNTSDAVLITDRRYHIVWVNEGFTRMSGYSREEALGQHPARLLHSEHNDPAVLWALRSACEAGEPFRGEVQHRAKNGDHYWLDLEVQPVRDAQGVITGFMSIETDISERKHAEHRLRETNAALLQARDHAERATQAKSEFLANMSHEIRTPMNAILGMLQLLMRTELNARQRDYTEKTQAAAHSLLGLLNDILDFSKVEAGKMSLDPHPFRLDTLLRDLGVVLAASVGDKPVQVLFDLDPTLPTSLVGDALRLRQVLLNLAGNAIKFTAQGHVLLRIAVAQRQAQSVTLDVLVRDTGIGIAPENQQRIFAGFVQAEGSTTRKFGGTGLGLAISRHLVHMMGGELKLESAEGQGSCFFFQLTLPTAAEPDSVAANTLRAVKVLLIHPDDVARDVLRHLLIAQGASLTVTADAAEALAWLEHTAFDCILTASIDEDSAGPALGVRLTQLRGATPAPVVIEVVRHSAELLRRHSAEAPPWRDAVLAQPLLPQALAGAVAEARAAAAPAPNAEAPRLSAPALTQPLPQRLCGLRVLVVDDNPTNQQIAHELLSDEGALVSTADNGAVAVASVRNADPQFHAVLMDVQMPVMDGYSATELIRREPRLKRLPIIAMTANAMDSDREACFAAGMNAHIGKPFELDELVHTLARLTGLERSALEAAAPAPSAPSPSAPGQAPGPALTQTALLYAGEHGIDLGAALQRMGGKVPVYLRSLRRFVDETRDLPAKVQALLQKRDLTGVQRQWHTLKGLAATLGLTHLARTAGAAEQAAQNAARTTHASGPPDTQAHQEHRAVASHVALQLATAHAHADALMAELSPKTQTAPSAPAALNTEALTGQLTHLLQLLEGADMRATDVFASIQAEFGAALEPRLSALDQALDQALGALDFGAAHELCQKLLRQLSPTTSEPL